MLSKRSRSNPSLVALVLVSGVGPFSTDTYLAALPELQVSLGTSSSAAQLTITACIVGLALGLLVGGTLSDGFGRRRLLLTGTVLFLVASVVCMIAPDVITLIVCRLVQGAASGASASIARAVISDRYAGVNAAKLYGTLAAIGLLAPVIAPAVGGVILAVADWRAVFAFMAVLGVITTTAVLIGIPETGTRVSEGSSLRVLREGLRRLMSYPPFRRSVVIQCFVTAGFFVYIGGSSFVIQAGLATDSSLYAIIFATNAAAMALAGLVFRLLITRVSAHRFRLVGILLSTSASAALVAAAVITAGHPPLWLAWTLLLPMVGGMGLTQPASTVISQELGRDAPGTAASLQAGLAFVAGAATTPLTGLINENSILVMSVLMLSFLSIASLLLARHRRVH